MCLSQVGWSRIFLASKASRFQPGCVGIKRKVYVEKSANVLNLKEKINTVIENFRNEYRKHSIVGFQKRLQSMEYSWKSGVGQLVVNHK